jgi:phosphoserine phosphatase
MMKKRPLVVFDMDGVLIHHRSSWRLVHEAVGTSNERSFQAYLRNEIDDEEFMRRDISLWMERGISSVTQVERLLDSASRMNGIEDCMGRLKALDLELAIISGGIDILAEKLGRELGIPRINANGLQTDGNGDLTGEGILRVPLRDKGSVLKAMMETNGYLGPAVAVGDSPVDITMFEEADLSIAFNPESPVVSRNADRVIEELDLLEVSATVIEYLK